MDSASYLHDLSLCPDVVRNFCMVAHVDHGKTTLSDFLVASNGVLSPQLAGKVRLLDSRPDEQERLITMKASSIALHHKMDQKDYLLHLVDSPGHIDFSCEVSTAIRLCDGALIIVDLVDGVTMQTCSMLRHVYREGLSLCLVLNKIDLLITRQQLTAEEAYFRMRSVIETCNATLAAYVNQLEIANEFEELNLVKPSDDVWFCPTKGNVIFSSCFDGWGFTVDSFAKIYEGKFGMKNLNQSLWGESYLDLKTKSVTSAPKKEGQPCMALQLIFEPVWQLHRSFLSAETPDMSALEAMSSKVGVAPSVWNRPRMDMRQKLGALLSSWLPLAKAVLDMVCHRIYSPVQAHKLRLPVLMPKLKEAPRYIQDALLSCSTADDAPPVAYICKLIDTEYLAGQMLGSTESGDYDDVFIGFARVYCGRLKANAKVLVHSNGTTTDGVIKKLFLLRGLGLEEVPEVCAGSLCGIAGLTAQTVKYATVCTLPEVPQFTSLALPSSSIVRLSVVPKDPTQMQQLIRGLHLLNKVDPQVEISILPTGEHVIGTAGEVHAERCIKDLHDTFARIELVSSEPIVSFRETVVAGVGKPKAVKVHTPDGMLAVSIVARPLPDEAIDLIANDARNSNAMQAASLVPRVMRVLSEGEDRKKWTEAVRNGVLSWGVSKLHFFGSLLLSSIRPLEESSSSAPTHSPTSDGTSGDGFPTETLSAKLLRLFKDAIIAGFQMAAAAGSMAEEPMFGVAFVVTDVEWHGEVPLQSVMAESASQLNGQLMVATREACRKACEQPGLGRRLVEPVYHCVVYSAGATQGKIYAILSRRRSEILEEVPNEGGDLFYISCHLPAVEAFNLQDELRIATHGAATAQLQVDHWGIVDADPYYKPTTREEIEEHGTIASGHNIGAALLERVRRRKGLHREIVVESAEKQKFSIKGA